MRLSLAQYAVRVAWGVGLLFVPAVQEKVCAASPPDDVQATRESSAPETSPEQGDEKKSAPLTLAALAPDTALPRWPNHLRLSAVSRARPLPAAASVDSRGDGSTPVCGVCGAFPPGLAPTARLPESDPPPALAATRECVRGAGHVFTSAILRTGPPTPPPAG